VREIGRRRTPNPTRHTPTQPSLGSDQAERWREVVRVRRRLRVRPPQAAASVESPQTVETLHRVETKHA